MLQKGISRYNQTQRLFPSQVKMCYLKRIILTRAKLWPNLRGMGLLLLQNGSKMLHFAQKFDIVTWAFALVTPDWGKCRIFL